MCKPSRILAWFFIAMVTSSVSMGACAPSQTVPPADTASAPAPTSPNAHEAALVESARQERELMVYTATTVEDLEREVAAFREKYPFLEVKYVRAPVDANIERILAEARAGQHIADVFSGLAIKAFKLRQAGLLAKYESPERASFPKEAQDPEGYWTSQYLLVGAMAYNTNLVRGSDIPKSYDDLLDPKWSGRKIGLYQLDATFFMNTIQAWGEAKALEWWRRLAEQKPAVREGVPVLTQLLVAGEFPLVARTNVYQIEDAKRKGAPVDWVRTGMVHTELNLVAIMAKAPHPNAARLWVDFMLSEAGQRIVSGHGRPPARQGVGGPGAEMISGVKLTYLDPGYGPEYDERTRQFQELLGIQ